MNKLMGVLLICSATCSAYEIKANPDRKPSIGFLYSQQHLAGERNIGGFANFPIESHPHSAYFDLRLPVDRHLTIEGGYSRSWESIEESRPYGNTDNLKGDGFRVGARYYF